MKKIDINLFNELLAKYWINTLEWQDMIPKELKKKMLKLALEWELWYKKWERRENKEKNEINEIDL